MNWEEGGEKKKKKDKTKLENQFLDLVLPPKKTVFKPYLLKSRYLQELQGAGSNPTSPHKDKCIAEQVRNSRPSFDFEYLAVSDVCL